MCTRVDLCWGFATVSTCSARIWARRHALGILSLVRSYPGWSQMMRGRRDPASSHNGIVLVSVFPAQTDNFFLKVDITLFL